MTVDPEKLNAVLAHWKKLERQTQREGLSWAEGLRWLAGAQSSSASAESAALTEYSRVIEGDWLHAALEHLRQPQNSDQAFCKHVLQPLSSCSLAPISTNGSALVVAIISVAFRRLSGGRYGTGKNSASIGVIAVK